MNVLTTCLQNEQLQTDESFELQRATRLWRFVAVVGGVWFVFASYYHWGGHPEPTKICAANSFACVSLLACRGLLRNSPFFACHYFLALCLIGIFSMTLSDASSYRESIYFLPLGIFLAGHLMGIRGAYVWTSIVCIAIGLRYYLGNPSQYPITVNNNDSLNNSLVFVAAILCICHQAESLFGKRTIQLKQLTRDLGIQNSQNHHLAITDSLTGVSNRYGLSKVCEQKVADAIDTGNEIAMLVVDFNKFKEVNDTLGHRVGDQLLKKIANRLENGLGNVRENETFVGRLGGDEFCIIASHIKNSSEAMAYAELVEEALCQPYEFEDATISVGASIGISLCPSQATDVSELLTFADSAMYKAKFGDKACVLYDPSMMDEVRSARELKEKLAAALDKGEFFLVYQPQVSFKTGRAFGAEALLRWRHEGEEILPWKFIPTLESSGLILPVGRWVVEEACRQLAIWQNKGYRYAVSVNVSTLQFADEGLVDNVRDSINRYGVDPQLLDFEITESVLIEDAECVVRRLNALKELGCSVSVDDFGTGYSSLSYLKRFPIDRLKIDREFVKDYPDQDDGIVASSIVALAKALDLQVLAEGIETPEQYQFLKNCGCEEYQGYICSKPVSPEACEQIFLEYDSVERFEKQGGSEAWSDLQKETANPIANAMLTNS